MYNNGYVTFTEIHKIVTMPEYYKEKIRESLSKLEKEAREDIAKTEKFIALKEKIKPGELDGLLYRLGRVSKEIKKESKLEDVDPDEEEGSEITDEELDEFEAAVIGEGW